MATTATMSTKGQIVIPRDLREHLGWRAGTRLEIVAGAGGVVIRPVPVFQETTVDDLVGLLPYAGPRRTIDEMNDAVARGARASATFAE